MLADWHCWASSPSCWAAQRSTRLSVSRGTAPELSTELPSPVCQHHGLFLQLLRGGYVHNSQGCAQSPLKMKNALEVVIIWNKCFIHVLTFLYLSGAQNSIRKWKLYISPNAPVSLVCKMTVVFGSFGFHFGKTRGRLDLNAFISMCGRQTWGNKRGLIGFGTSYLAAEPSCGSKHTSSRLHLSQVFPMLNAAYSWSDELVTTTWFCWEVLPIFF